MARAKQKVKHDLFWQIYMIYLLVIAIGLCFVYYYVRGIMLEHESRTPDTYILELLEKADSPDSELAKYMEANCFGGAAAKYGDPAARSSRFYSLAKNSKLTVEPSSASYDSAYPAYEVLADGKPFLTVVLAEGQPYTRLGILTISDWTIDSCILRSAAGDGKTLSLDQNRKLSYDFDYPEGFTLTIDGAPFTDMNGIRVYELGDFMYVAPYTQVPRGQKIKIEGLSFEPEFKIFNNVGESVKITERPKHSYSVEPVYAESEEAMAMADSLDPLAIATLWSKFMTNDVGGKTHGLGTVTDGCRLMEGSNLYTLAKDWATSVDITFVSHHKIDSWTNGKIDNCIKYSDDFFTCDVYIEKNMTLTTRAQRTDVFNNRMYFVRIEDKWYLVDMYPLDGNSGPETETD